MAQKNKERAPNIRKLAEESFQGLPVTLDRLSPEDIQTLLHELQIHQIELELQNDELRKAQDALEVAHRKYSNLYEFAPLGYFTLNQAGLIEEVNLAGATLLGTARRYVINRPFSEFVYPEDQDIYYLNLRRFFGTPATLSIDVRLLKQDHTPIYVRLVCLVIQNDETKTPQALIMATDLTELKQHEEEAQILAATQERERLARDLHDAVSQTLFATALTAETLPRLWDRSPERVRGQLVLLHQLSKGALAEMRALLLELRPTALLEADLKSLLNQLVDAIKSRKHIAFSLDIQPDLVLPPPVRLVFYRIAQEALNNVVKYARAKHVTIRLVYAEACLELLIQDDGRGFDLERVLPTSLGLKIMRERAEAIGASLTISSEIMEGTCVKVVWHDLVPELKLETQ
jgi:PAS domain S-box-containing protein